MTQETTAIRTIDVFDLRLFGSVSDPTLDSDAARAAAAAAFENDDVLAALDRSANEAAGLADVDIDGLDATPGAEDAAPADDEAPAGAAPTTEQAGAAPASEATAAASGEAPPPKPAAVNMDEEIDLGHGMKMSRAAIAHQVANAGRVADEANTFREVFGMSAGEARAQWAPLLEKMRADEAFRNGMQEWINAWVAAHPEGEITDIVAPEKRPVLTVEDVNRAATRVVSEAERQRELNFQVAREVEALKEKYPALRDPNTLGMLGASVVMRGRTDPNWTITKGAEAISDVLRAIERGATPPETIADPSLATPRKPTAPALVGGNGAAPNGTQRPTTAQIEEVAFEDLDEGVKDWIKVRKQYGFTD